MEYNKKKVRRIDLPGVWSKQVAMIAEIQHRIYPHQYIEYYKSKKNRRKKIEDMSDTMLVSLYKFLRGRALLYKLEKKRYQNDGAGIDNLLRSFKWNINHRNLKL